MTTPSTKLVSVLCYIHDKTKHITDVLYSPTFKTIPSTAQDSCSLMTISTTALVSYSPTIMTISSRALIYLLSCIHDNTNHSTGLLLFPTFMTIPNTALVSSLSFIHHLTKHSTGLLYSFTFMTTPITALVFVLS